MSRNLKFKLAPPYAFKPPRRIHGLRCDSHSLPGSRPSSPNVTSPSLIMLLRLFSLASPSCQRMLCSGTQ
eukprot:s4194_g3.t1